MKRKSLILFVFAIALSNLYSTILDVEIIGVFFSGAANDIEFGFSSNEIKKFNDTPVEITSVDFALSGTNSDRVASFYVWWKVYTQNAINIEIKSSGPLQNDSDTSIPWKGTVGGKDLSSDTSDGATIKIEQRNYPVAGSQSVELKIHADNLNDIARGQTGVFRSTITVTVSEQ